MQKCVRYSVINGCFVVKSDTCLMISLYCCANSLQYVASLCISIIFWESLSISYRWWQIKVCVCMEISLSKNVVLHKDLCNLHVYVCTCENAIWCTKHRFCMYVIIRLNNRLCIWRRMIFRCLVVAMSFVSVPSDIVSTLKIFESYFRS